MRQFYSGLIVTVLTLFPASIVFALPTPSCRLDSTLAGPVEHAANFAINAYYAKGKTLPFKKAVVNSPASDALTIEIVIDATQDSVDSKGCVKPKIKAIGKRSLDRFTVNGGCYVSSENDRLIRCSSSAISVFVGKDVNENPASPALLYILAHELAHIYQGRHGEFTGEIKNINLKQSVKNKQEELASACKPKFPSQVKDEKEADELALIVLLQKMSATPYKEPTLSTRGSMYWNIDKINLAVNEWTELKMKRWGLPQPKVHSAFVPEEFPMPEEKIKLNAHNFVCDVLTTPRGIISFPLRETTHPAPEQRLRRIAEVLKPLADKLPDSDGSNVFAPIANLQKDVSPIFTFMYKETGVYMENLHKEVCTLNNGESPESNCGKHNAR